MSTSNAERSRTNFGHLEVHDAQLVRLGMLAERYFADDPNTALLKLRQLCELLAQLVATKIGLYTSRDEAQYDLVRRLQEQGIIELNETRVDLREKFETLIDNYNAGSMQIEALFLELLNLSRGLTEEESRSVREQLTEEELVVFDLLTRPGPDLTTEERTEVKKVARQLLAKLQGVLTIDWQKTAQARARVRDAIETELDDGLPRAYTPELFKTKAGAVFQHVYDRYQRVA